MTEIRCLQYRIIDEYGADVLEHIRLTHSLMTISAFAPMYPSFSNPIGIKLVFVSEQALLYFKNFNVSALLASTPGSAARPT